MAANKEYKIHNHNAPYYNLRKKLTKHARNMALTVIILENKIDHSLYFLYLFRHNHLMLNQRVFTSNISRKNLAHKPLD